MHTISESEARALLSNHSVCSDPELPGWIQQKDQPSCSILECGLTSLEGVGRGLYLQLQFYQGPVTKLRGYKFTVFHLTPSGPQRVYQLEVKQHSRLIKDKHAFSHEHIGRLRQLGSSTWSRWSFDEVMAHFCKQTNVTFNSHVPDPEHFELKP